MQPGAYTDIHTCQHRLVQQVVAGLKGQAWQATAQDAGMERTLNDAVGRDVVHLLEAVSLESYALWENYTQWVQRLKQLDYLAIVGVRARLEVVRGALGDILAPEHAVLAADYITRSLVALDGIDASAASFLSSTAPHADLSRQYLDALLQGDKPAATRLILNALAAGVTVKEVYLDVFQVALREVGRLWELAAISVAQEHFCTALTQYIMAQMLPQVFHPRTREPRVLVATCIGGELHEIGVRMIADLLELEGWDTRFLGANTPIGGIVDYVQACQAEVLAISVTMLAGLGQVNELIQRVRTASHDGPKIVVGGMPFNVDTLLWKQVGADGYAADAGAALMMMESLLNRPADDG